MCAHPDDYIQKPFIPKEYRHLKRSEMPEPYRTMIDHYIQRRTQMLAYAVTQSRCALFYYLAIGIPLIAAAAIVLMSLRYLRYLL